jgi:hypothetical protein
MPNPARLMVPIDALVDATVRSDTESGSPALVIENGGLLLEFHLSARLDGPDFGARFANTLATALGDFTKCCGALSATPSPTELSETAVLEGGNTNNRIFPLPTW